MEEGCLGTGTWSSPPSLGRPAASTSLCLSAERARAAQWQGLFTFSLPLSLRYLPTHSESSRARESCRLSPPPRLRDGAAEGGAVAQVPGRGASPPSHRRGLGGAATAAPRLRWRRDGGCGLPHRCRPVSPPAPPPRLRTCCSSTYRRRCIAVAPPLLRPAPPSTCRPRPIHSSLPLPSSPCRSDSARCRAPAGRDGPGRAGPGRAGAVGMASGFGGGARRAAHEFRPRSVEPWLPGGGAAHAPCAARGTASHGSSNQPARWLLLPSLENSIVTLRVARVGVELVSRQGRG